MAKPKTSVESRFWPKVDKNGPNGCWLWVASKTSSGYGHFANQCAHRVAYELLVGPIPEGLEIDHLCRVRHCVNPEHMEPVTHRVNIDRRIGKHVKPRALRSHCAQGHEWTPDNTYYAPNQTWRSCRKCRLVACRKAYHRRADRLKETTHG